MPRPASPQMTSTPDPATQFKTEIGSLIAEIEACMPSAAKPGDREFLLQREAFRERACQARWLAERLAGNTDRLWRCVDGDAERLREALKQSRAYFGGITP